ncbi:MAG: hypothetical protein IT544_00395 [Rhodobacteraceae bacterium]|nr:hypothetical protein [Paracoccaceae bacterium]
MGSAKLDEALEIVPVGSEEYCTAEKMLGDVDADTLDRSFRSNAVF